MKSSLTLLPVFFVALLAALAVCPFFYSLSQAELFAALAAGDGAFFFAENLQNALGFLPSAVVAAFTAVFIFIVRRRMEGIGALLVFLAIFLLSFALLGPAAARLGASLRLREAERPPLPAGMPQAGLIQEIEPRLKAVGFRGPAGIAPYVLVAADTSGRAGGRGLNVYGGRDAALLLSGPQRPALDLQIARKIEAPAFLGRLSRDIGAVHSIISDAALDSAGGYAWTGGAFFALAASFFFLCALADWKLVNLTLYAIALRVLYWLFPLMHGDACIGFLRRFMPRFFSDAALAALPALLAAAALAALGFAIILPRYTRRNQGGEFL